MANPFRSVERTPLGDADEILLQSLLDADDSAHRDGTRVLTDRERFAFRRMREALDTGERGELTIAQRDWLVTSSRMIEDLESDRALLDLLLERDDLRDYERDMYEDMRDKLASVQADRPRRALTTAQRGTAEKTADRLELVYEARRSAGQPPLLRRPPPEGLQRRERLLPFEQPGYVKPLKPPGRS